LSDYTSIADVGSSLMSVIRSEMLLDPSLSAKFTSADSITLDPPTDDAGGLGSAALSIYLYRILEDPYLKNQPQVIGRGGLPVRSPLCLDLYYLMTPLLADTRDQHIVLGKLMQILYDRPTLEGADLIGGLAGSNDRIRAVFNPVSLEESARVWQALETAYRLSVCYTLRVTMISSTIVSGAMSVLDSEFTVGAR
jgi:Pvc16 N-terminal domain